jgi:hypothetical protein
MSGAGNPYAIWAPGSKPQTVSQQPSSQTQNPYDKYLLRGTEQAQAPSPETPAPFTWAGLGKQLATGVAQGATSLGGMGMDAMNFVEGDPRNTYNAIQQLQGKAAANFPSNTQQLDKSVTSVTGPYRQPQNTPERYAQTVGEFVPGAIGGPEGVIPKIVSVVGPALVSETLGQAAKGTGYEPAARIIGALAGGGLGSAVTSSGSALASALRGGASGADSSLTAANNFKNAGDAYARAFANNGGVSLPPEATNLPDAVKSAFQNDTQGALRIDDPLQTQAVPKTKLAYDILTNAVTTPNAKLADLEFARRAANDALMQGGQDAHFGGILRDHIDDFMGNMSGTDDLSDARSDFRIAKKTQVLEDRINNAQADANAGRGDINRNVTNQFLSLSKNQKLMAQFSPDEQSAITNVAAGSPSTQALRTIGKFVGGPVGQTVGGIGGGALGAGFGGLGMLGGAVEGVRGAKNIGEGLTKFSLNGANNRAQLARSLVANGGVPNTQVITGAGNGKLANVLLSLMPGAIGSFAAAQGSQ